MITREADYAIRIVQFLADCYGEDRTATAKEISDVMSVPYRHLRLIAGKLTSAGILQSRRGSLGGYGLTRDPKDVSVLDVLSAISPRSTLLNMCMDEKTPCTREGHCKLHLELEKLQRDVDVAFSNIRFSTLKQGS